LRPEEVFLPGLAAPWVVWKAVSILLAVLWLVFFTNAFNFIDGLDGLASGQAVIAGLGLCLLPLAANISTLPLMTRHQYSLAAILAAGCAGAALGFWRYNRWPARIFLGEAGSSLLGFFLGLSGLLFLGRAPSAWLPMAVFVILGWPLLDAGTAIIRRLKRGEPISKADHGHLHHRLLDRGFTNSAAAAFIHSVAVLLAAAGLVLAWL
jgi:UDP-GlcNAc:undecaprenyl-phosphate GlcNAc-1-phosphate transferase